MFFIKHTYLSFEKFMEIDMMFDLFMMFVRAIFIFFHIRHPYFISFLIVNPTPLIVWIILTLNFLSSLSLRYLI